MTLSRQLHLGAILEGVAADQHAWRDPALPSNPSIRIDWYVEQARLAEALGRNTDHIKVLPGLSPILAEAAE